VAATLSRIDEASSRRSIRFRGEDDTWLESDSMASEIRRAVPLPTRKRFGQFFTSSDLVKKVWARVLPTLGPTSVVADPACGAGNLLIPAAEFLREQYGSVVAANQLRGHDLNGALARGTRDRLSAILGADLPQDSFTENDYLQSSASALRQATHVIMNPPFVMVDRPEGAAWANRRVNAAALFVINALTEMRPGSKLIAILPDVLRSGSSYQRWRKEVSRLTSQFDVVGLGVFDAHTDVDVFSLHADAAGSTPTELAVEKGWNVASSLPFGTIGESFNVRVGSVVPHRTPPTAASAPFLTARQVQPGATVNVVGHQAAVATLDQGPFVIVRRTSSPRDGQRIRANLIADTRAIGVENHLIVLTPIAGGLGTCHELISNFRDPRTDEFVNERIRCRHLTVDSVKSIPWWSANPRAGTYGAH
jgi:hypothetical protein